MSYIMHLLARAHQVTSFVVEYATSEEFVDDDTVRIEAKKSYFISDRRMDNGTTWGVYETDVTGLQVMLRCRRQFVQVDPITL